MTQGKKHIFSSDDDEQIKKLYQEKVGMGSVTKDHPVRDLAKQMGIPRWCISRRAALLGVHAIQKKQPNWSDKEIRILIKNARYSPETIKKKLKWHGFSRSVCGIVLKRKRMRCLKNLEGQSAYSLSECFGLDRHSIMRWIKDGFLKAERRETNRTENQGGDPYYIKDKEIKKFIINYVDEIDFRKINKYWLVDLLSAKIKE